MRLISGFILLFCVSCSAQQFLQRDIQSSVEDQFPKILSEFREFLTIKNDGHFPEQINNNLVWCKEALKKRKFEVTVLSSNGIPHLLGKRIFDSSLPTVLVYMQIDGQPVSPAEWDQTDPFEATLKIKSGDRWLKQKWEAPFNKESRIFARSASDSKGPTMAFLSALDILDLKRIKPAFNIKCIMDFQEEMGSPGLPDLIIKNKDLFDARAVLIMDGTRHVSNLPTLNFGARGIATIKLKVFGANTELHSGQYGNYAPNPVFKLAKLLAGMKDENGKVLIPKFYDGIEISAKDKELLRNMPGDDLELNQRIGIKSPERVGDNYEESLQYPSLNVRGLRAADIGQDVRTIIPAEAIAEIDMRLVPETPGQRQIDLIKAYISSQGYHFVKDNPTDEERKVYDKLISFDYKIGSKPFRTDLDSPFGLWLSRSMDRVFGKGNYVNQRTTGGSQPIEPFITTLGIPAVSIRFPNPDNNIHAANENLSIGAFIEGIEMCVGVLTEPMSK